MTAFVFLIVFLALLAAAGLAVLFDLGADTRDPDYALGRLLESRQP